MASILRKNSPDPHVGARFGRWVVLIGRTAPMHGHHGHYRCLCRCDCGVEKWVSVNDLTRTGHKGSLSCGCLRRELAGTPQRTHGASKTRLYNIWCGMKKRCDNPEGRAYHWYGERGIGYYSEWATFEPFQAWAAESGYQDNLTLDRKDSDGPYEPSNCRWIPLDMQSRNKRCNIRAKAFGMTKLLVEWAEDARCVVTYDTLHGRLTSGWEPEDAITTPPLRQGDRYARR